MKIRFNGEILHLPDFVRTVKDFLEYKEISLKGKAIAVNNQVIQKSNAEKIQIKENDNILIITATQGG
ncbi:MAG: sulfur carrier protein ThiS [Bacteroidetes bacterium]|nr:MAG: sulfur carrier protein ThiS [Bacteroidota bacterium]